VLGGLRRTAFLIRLDEADLLAVLLDAGVDDVGVAAMSAEPWGEGEEQEEAAQECATTGHQPVADA